MILSMALFLVLFVALSVVLPIAPSVALSTLKSPERDYKYLNVILKLFTISSKNILIIYKKTFIKTEDLASFNKIKKYSKIWDYETPLLKV